MGATHGHRPPATRVKNSSYDIVEYLGWISGDSVACRTPTADISEVPLASGASLRRISGGSTGGDEGDCGGIGVSTALGLGIVWGRRGRAPHYLS